MIGFLMLSIPIVFFVLTIPLSRRLPLVLRKIYLSFGAIIVFLGSGISFYFASFTGDQGGIAAYFFQIGVISLYALLIVIVACVYQGRKMKNRQHGDNHE